MTDKRKPKTESEQLFDEYLKINGYDYDPEKDFEPQFEGKSKRPDFRFRWRETEYLFDAKERVGKRGQCGPGQHPRACHFDAAKGIRRLIEKGREKFKGFKDYCCSLVVFNAGDRETWLRPDYVFAAMLGDLGVEVGLDVDAGVLHPETAREAFLEHGGKMIQHYDPLCLHESPKNISSVVILNRQAVPKREYVEAYEAGVARKEAELRRALNGRERAVIRSELIDSHPLPFTHIPRVIVCENPFARRPLPHELFRGPYDERWEAVQEMKRTYVGSALQESEAAEEDL